MRGVETTVLAVKELGLNEKKKNVNEHTKLPKSSTWHTQRGSAQPDRAQAGTGKRTRAGQESRGEMSIIDKAKYKLIAFAVERMVDMGSILKVLQGWKGYIVCASGILTALLAYIDGTLTLSGFIAAIFAGTAGMTFSAKGNRIAKSLSSSALKTSRHSPSE